MAADIDTQRLIGDLKLEGVVVSVDHAVGAARVKFKGEFTTGDIPCLAS